LKAGLVNGDRMHSVEDHPGRPAVSMITLRDPLAALAASASKECIPNAFGGRSAAIQTLCGARLD